jgi:tetratricopeptide (TPR) repeat protein
VLNNLAGLDMRELDLDAARSHLGDALAIARTLRSDSVSSTVLTNLGLAAVMAGDYDAAAESYREALEVSRRMGNLSNTAYAVNGLALCRSAASDDHTAILLHGAADAVFEATGEALDTEETALREQDVATLRQKVGTTDFEATYARGLSLPSDAVFRLAMQSALGQ